MIRKCGFGFCLGDDSSEDFEMFLKVCLSLKKKNRRKEHMKTSLSCFVMLRLFLSPVALWKLSVLKTDDIMSSERPHSKPEL